MNTSRRFLDAQIEAYLRERIAQAGSRTARGLGLQSLNQANRRELANDFYLARESWATVDALDGEPIETIDFITYIAETIDYLAPKVMARYFLQLSKKPITQVTVDPSSPVGAIFALHYEKTAARLTADQADRHVEVIREFPGPYNDPA